MNAFFNWWRVLAELVNLDQRVAALETAKTNQEKKMATLAEDIARMETDLAAQGALISQVATTVASNTSTITDLKAQIAALQGQTNPDLGPLEAGIAQLEKNNSDLAAALAPPNPPTPGV